tara:strand:+ start:452 stop:712 length:261 start_codon:yes stop_codon:yes gene_type:complete
MKNKLYYYIILIILIILCISFYIIKQKDINIDNWNIIKIINNYEIEKFENQKQLCDDIKKIGFINNINDIEQKNRIIDAICNKKNK